MESWQVWVIAIVLISLGVGSGVRKQFKSSIGIAVLASVGAAALLAIVPYVSSGQ